MESKKRKLFVDDNELDIAQFFLLLWDYKKFIVVFTGIIALMSVFYALSIPNTYRSQVLLSPVQAQGSGGIGSSLGSLGGLASLAGINLPSMSGDSKAEALAVLRSHSFISNYIVSRDLMASLMAATGWDDESNKLIINSSVYDEDKKKWVSKRGGNAKPSLQEAVRSFRAISEVGNDKKTGFITIHVDSFSPDVARQWVDWLVEDINEFMRVQEVTRATKSLAYLNEQVSKTKVSEIKNVLSELIKSETQVIMMSESTPEYMFRTIDPAIAPEIKLGPKRSIICIVSTIIGGIISVLITLLIHYFNPPWAHRLK